MSPTAEKQKDEAFDYGEAKPNGQYTNYPVLPEEDRKRGFIRPVRHKYVHVGVPGSTHGQHVARQLGKDAPPGTGCGVVTHMGLALAETYARDPTYYGSTFCVGCHDHFPVGAEGEFVWDGTTERVGT